MIYLKFILNSFRLFFVKTKKMSLPLCSLFLVFLGMYFTNACSQSVEEDPSFVTKSTPTPTPNTNLTPTPTPGSGAAINFSLKYIQNKLQEEVGYQLVVLSDKEVEVSNSVNTTWLTPDTGKDANGQPIAFVYEKVGNLHQYTITRSFEKYWFGGHAEYLKTHKGFTISFRKVGETEPYSQNINFPEQAKPKIQYVDKPGKTGFTIDVYNAGPGAQIKSAGDSVYDWTNFRCETNYWTCVSDTSFLNEYIIYHIDRDYSFYGDSAKGKSFTLTVKNALTNDEVSQTISVP